jgi:hypothetical protein
MTRRVALLTGLLLVAPLAVAHAQEEAAAVDSLALARQYTAWLYAGAADSLIAHSSELAKSGFSTPERWAQYSETILERGGIEVEVVEETWKLRNGQCQYWRTANFSGMEEALLVRWVLNEEGEIAAVGLGPASQPPMVESEEC